MSSIDEAAVRGRAEANKAIVQSFVATWNTREFERFDELMGDDAVLHVGGNAVSCNPAGTRAIAEEWTTAFPDWRFSLLALVAEDDYVVAHLPYSGTHRGAIAGVAPTGRFCTVDEIVIFRIADGRIVEAWEVFDEAGMWRQLGVPAPA
jgi:steroid delta-isomerase-like uncharacterized protein